MKLSLDYAILQNALFHTLGHKDSAIFLALLVLVLEQNRYHFNVVLQMNKKTRSLENRICMLKKNVKYMKFDTIIAPPNVKKKT